MTRFLAAIITFLFVSPVWAGCSSAKLEEVRSAHSKAVVINCNLNLRANETISKRFVLEGKSSSGVTIDCHGGSLRSLSIRSRSYLDGGVRRWEPVTNVKVRNCTVTGSIHIMGMARTGEGTVYDEINPFKMSSRKIGHTVRARANAPTNITLDNLTITGHWIYIAPGVTRVNLTNSLLTGIRKRGAIYLDAESGFNVIENNRIEVTTRPKFGAKLTNQLGFLPGIQAVSIDASSHNTIKNNQFTVDHDAIHFYRNCGEGGVIRHTSPSHNTITNNEFRGKNPRIYIGSRGGKGTFPVANSAPCRRDEGYLEAGSAESNKDQARYNTVSNNRFYTRKDLTLDDVIQSKDWEDNSPNLISDNELVADR